jgi:hypothetical protein
MSRFVHPASPAVTKMMSDNPWLKKSAWTESFTECDGKLKEALGQPEGVFASFDQTVTPVNVHLWNVQLRRFVYEIMQNYADQTSHTMAPHDKDALRILTATRLCEEEGAGVHVYGVGLAPPDDPEQGLITASATGFIKKCGHRELDEAWAGKFAVLYYEIAHVLHPSVFKNGVQAKTSNNDGGGHGEGFKLASRWCTSAGLTLVFLFFTGPYVVEMSSTSQTDINSAGKPSHISDLLLAGFRIRVMARNVDSDETVPLLPPSHGVTMEDLRDFDLERDPTPQMISFIAVDAPGVKVPPGLGLHSAALTLEDVWAQELSKLTIFWTPPLDPKVPILRCTVPAKDGDIHLTLTKATNYTVRPELRVDPRFCKTFDGSCTRMLAHGIAYQMAPRSCKSELLFATSGSGKPGSVAEDNRSLATFLDSNRNPENPHIAKLIKMIVRATLEHGDRVEVTFLRQAFESIFGDPSWAFEPTDTILSAAIDKQLIYQLFDIDPETLFYIAEPRSDFVRNIWPGPPALAPLREITGPAAYSFSPVNHRFLEGLFLRYAAACTDAPAPMSDEEDGTTFRVSVAPEFMQRLMRFALRDATLLVRYVDVGPEPRFACRGDGYCILSPQLTTPRILCVPIQMPLRCRWKEGSSTNGVDYNVIKSVLIGLETAVDREMCTELSVKIVLKAACNDDIEAVCDEAIADVKREKEKMELLLKERARATSSAVAAAPSTPALQAGVSAVQALAASVSVSKMMNVVETVQARPALAIVPDRFSGWLVEESPDAHPTGEECAAKAKWAVPELAWIEHRLLDLFSTPTLPFIVQFVYSPGWSAYGSAQVDPKMILLNMHCITSRHDLRHTMVHELGHLGTVSDPSGVATWREEPALGHNSDHNTHCLDILTWLLRENWNVSVAMLDTSVRRASARSA